MVDEDVAPTRSAEDPGDGHRLAEADWTLLQRFSELITHELRTPMAVVKLAADTLRTNLDGMEPDDIRELVDVMDRNSRLAFLLLDRLTLARSVENESVKLSLESVDLRQLVEESVSDLAGFVLGHHPTTITGDVDVTVLADPTALREIVFNLLANAAKYSGPTSPIDIRLDRTDDQSHVTIRDHGRGIQADDIEFVFGEYTQVDSGSSGVGLGLFISRGLARAHDGDLAVGRSGEDGTEFVLTIPSQTLHRPDERLAA